MSPAEQPADSQTILFVDDEPQACKWFARMFSDEFSVITATGVDDALALLRDTAKGVAVVVTDHRMPRRVGLELLQILREQYPHTVGVLATAYADKDVAVAAVNEGQVFRILEKPLDEARTRETLRAALAQSKRQEAGRPLQEIRAAVLRETLGFLAHELKTPLATVRGYIDSVRDRRAPAAGAGGMVSFAELRPGEVMEALDGAERRTLFCQQLVATFVRSARDAYGDPSAAPGSASALVDSLLEDFPFEYGERAWVTRRIEADFVLPGRRDLLYLALCTITRNALLALRSAHEPRLAIEVGTRSGTPSWIRFADNGPGISAPVLALLTQEPVTTRADAGGTGMGLMFCRRVMRSVGGDVEVASQPGRGATVSLYFPQATAHAADRLAA